MHHTGAKDYLHISLRLCCDILEPLSALCAFSYTDDVTTPVAYIDTLALHGSFLLLALTKLRCRVSC